MGLHRLAGRPPAQPAPAPPAQNYHCRFHKPLVMPRPDGLSVQMSIAVSQLFMEVLQRTSALDKKHGRFIVHESTSDGVRAGQFAFAMARAVKAFMLPVEVVVMQPQQAVFDYLAGKAMHFDENDRLVLVQKGCARARSRRAKKKADPVVSTRCRRCLVQACGGDGVCGE